MMTDAAITHANRLAETGQIAEAVALLEQAGDRGDVDALMQLAVWRLSGKTLPRDLVGARLLLRRAVEIGHVDAALMEIALTATGAGGPADWGRARHLLAVAANDDPVAARQCAILSAMALRADGMAITSPGVERISTIPNIWLARGFLSAEECAYVAETATPLLGPSRVIDPVTGQQIAHPVRTAHDGAIGPARENLVIRAINHRIAALSGTRTDQGEPLTVLHYAVGQQYRPHVDTIAGANNQRIKTVLLYLNEGYGGGQTQFLHPHVMIDARAGDAVLFENVGPDGRPDPRSQHAGLPVTHGAKWLATRWIRAARYDPWDPS